MDAILKTLSSSEEQEVYVLDCLSYFMMVMAFLNCVTLLFEHVPYGRYAPSSYGFPVHVKFAWFVQELPAFWWKSTPFISFVLALVFCIYNGYLQARYRSHYADYPPGWVTHPCFIIGSCMWLLGCIINIHSNHILRNLRKPGETDYKIPRVCIRSKLLWGDLAAHSAHSAAFALFTLVVLCSRGMTHHKWYLTKFEDYTKSRKALIPFVL
uniref:3-oxo-5-alpha-steroid 4-dehydrogenase C-terminal domain-containing protein n=2 Tax=Cyprinus carpio TaxID=7962 RepID=A0A8C0YG44_CYPCA